MTDDLNAMATFVAVAEARGFRAAAERLDVTASAVSQSLRRLEERLGVVLVQRTTRSVRLTEAGERLYASVRPALEEVRSAVASVGALSAEPRGTLRLHVASAAAGYLNASLIAAFIAENKHVQLELRVSDEPLDLVTEGYDAGIRLGEVIERDMIAVPVSGDIRLVVVAAPSYLTRHAAPTHPRELVEHDCINTYALGGARPYRWEFTERGREFAVDVRARILTNDPALNLRLARAGAGITIGSDGRVRDDVARGELVPLLEEFSTPFPGYYLCYPQRRQATPALRALIEHLRAPRKKGARRR